MSTLLLTLSNHLAAIRSRMTAACQIAGRPTDNVQLIAVTKYAKVEWIEGLISLGVTQFGENRPQQLLERQARWPQVQWHLIGHLQRNKAKGILGTTALMHSIDSWRLAERLSELAQGDSTVGCIPMLCEVNVSGEASKDGFTIAELLVCWDQLLGLPGLEVRGLMTMAPLANNPDEARPVFAKLRQLRDELQTRVSAEVSLSELSMGMSGDFEVAIEEGATLIRVGSRLFEGLD